MRLRLFAFEAHDTWYDGYSTVNIGLVEQFVQT